MKTRAMLLLVALMVADAVAVSAQPTVGEDFVGVWQGFITGREMGGPGGMAAQNAHLVIAKDGTWTMTAAGWQATGAVTTSRGRALVLEGYFVAKDRPGQRLAPASFRLSSWREGALGGSASTQFGGRYLTTGIQLAKSPASNGASASPATTGGGPRSNFSASAQLPTGFALNRTGHVIQTQ